MRKLKALDCFCGWGGWSDGLALEGFDVLGIENNWRIAQWYQTRHKVLYMDFLKLHGKDFEGYDLIVGSPPCREFTSVYSGHWKDPKDPKKGLVLVYAYLEFVKEAKPRYWLMENVPYLAKYLSLKPRVKTRLSKGMIRCFWGNFPAFLIIRDFGKKNIKYGKFDSRFKKWERAKIPLSISRSLGRTVRNAVFNGC